MTERTYEGRLSSLALEFTCNDDVELQRLKLHDPVAGASLRGKVPPSIAKFFEDTDGFWLRWTHAGIKGSPRLHGNVDLLRSADMTKSLEGFVWFEHTPEDDPMRRFRIIDNVSDEVWVGFFPDRDCLYYCSAGEDPISLEVDLNGYVDLLRQSRGFAFWQRAILMFLDGRKYPEAEKLKKYMPQLFPDFRFEEFRALFDKVRLGSQRSAAKGASAATSKARSAAKGVATKPAAKTRATSAGPAKTAKAKS